MAILSARPKGSGSDVPRSMVALAAIPERRAMALSEDRALAQPVD